MGKPADQEVGFTYPAGGGNDIGVYKQPQTVSVDDTSHGQLGAQEINISVGNVCKSYNKPTNPFGQKEMRGYGAATKGRKISGKQG